MDEKIIRLLQHSHFGKIPLKIDASVRHKWPEEKPEKPGGYLVAMDFKEGCPSYRVVGFWDGKWKLYPWEVVTHWWELPEVKEC